VAVTEVVAVCEKTIVGVDNGVETGVELTDVVADIVVEVLAEVVLVVGEEQETNTNEITITQVSATQIVPFLFIYASFLFMENRLKQYFYYLKMTTPSFRTSI